MQAPSLWVQWRIYQTAFTRPYFVSRIRLERQVLSDPFCRWRNKGSESEKWFAKGKKKARKPRSREYISEHTLRWEKTRQHFTICLGELWWRLTVAAGHRTLLAVCKELSGPNKIQLDLIVTWRRNLLICVCTAKLYRGGCDTQLRPKRKYWHMTMQTLGCFFFFWHHT